MTRDFSTFRRTNQQNRTGAMLPIIAVVMSILFVACVLGIDIARIHVTRSELRTATDAAARAAVEALGRTQNVDTARNAAFDVARQNFVAGDGLDLDLADIVFGVSSPAGDGSFQFTPGGSLFNSVQVTGSRVEESADGSVATFFGPMFGVDGFEPVQSSVATRLDRDIALVLDVSGSMGVQNRFAALKNAVRVFLRELEQTVPDENVSLVVYESTARKLEALTKQMPRIVNAIDREAPGGATAIGRGLNVGLDSLLNDPGSRPFALKSVIVMTDGNHNTGVNPTNIATVCAQRGITVHTITFSSGADQNLMRQVANIGGGIHLHADSNQQLRDAFAEIANQLEVMLTE